jgi:HEAT repeat protein
MLTAAILLLLAAPQDDKAAEEALDAFKTAYKSTSEADRVSAVNDLAKVHHSKTLTRLAGLLVSDGPSVRLAAAKGISGFAEMKKPAASALSGAMGANSKETTVHAGLYDALGKLEEPSSAPVLIRGFDEKETVVAKAAVGAAGQLGGAASIDPLIELLKKQEKAQKAAAGGGVEFTRHRRHCGPELHRARRQQPRQAGPGADSRHQQGSERDHPRVQRLGRDLGRLVGEEQGDVQALQVARS